MRRATTLALAALLFCLAGCGSSGEAPSTPRSSAPVESAAPDPEPTYAPGTRNETEYVSEWLGLRYVLTDRMTMVTDDEMRQLTQTGSEMLFEDPDSAQQIIDNAEDSLTYEMMAVEVSTGNNLSILVEKLVLSGITEEQYTAALREQLGQLSADLVFAEEEQRELCGISFSTLSYSLTADTVSTNQIYFIRKMGDRMVSIILSYADEAGLERLLEGFSAL